MARALLVVAAVALIAALVRADGEVASDFECPLCVDSLKELDGHAQQPLRSYAALKQFLAESPYCRTAKNGHFNPCDVMLPALQRLAATQQSLPASPRDACVQIGLCSEEVILGVSEANRAKLASTPYHDLRVAFAHGSRDYYSVRLSYVDQTAHNHSAEFMQFFDYTKPFKYVWTEKWLHSTVRPLSNTSRTTTFNLGTDFNITVRMPPKGKGVRGLLVGDPCFSGEYVGCRHGKEIDLFNRLTQLLNTALVRDVDTWFIVGDNFYDPHGVLAPQFMQALSLEAKSQPVLSVPGNHDFWQHGTPKSKTGYDTYGNGYMQYWLTDTQAAVSNEKSGDFTPFDFTVDPSTKKVANVNNFFTYNLIGNLATIAFSGAHDQGESDPLLQEACKWVADVKPAFVFVVGHWSSEGLGCAKGMDTRNVHSRVITMPGCKEMKDRIKWIEGHAHCNVIIEKDTGFRVAGFGMGGCDKHKYPNFGIPYFEITDDQELTIGYFPIAGGNGTVPIPDEAKPSKQDIQWDTLISCIESKGLGGCKDLGVEWLRQKA